MNVHWYCSDGHNSYEMYILKADEQDEEEEMSERHVEEIDLSMLKVVLLPLQEQLNRDVRSMSSYVEPSVIHSLSLLVYKVTVIETSYIYNFP